MTDLPKKDLLVWSGGLDSTAIFYDCFLARKPIDIIYFDLRNNYTKGRAEIIARDRIKQILKFNFPEATDYLNSITDRIYEINQVHPISNGMVTYWQPFLWLTSVIQNIHTEVDYQNILMGYVQKDDFWHIRREFEAAYKNLQFMVNPHSGDYFSNSSIKWPSLKYPYEWVGKQEIINKLSYDKVGRLILKQVWFCECAEGQKFEFKPCGHCIPCLAWAKLDIPADADVIVKEDPFTIVVESIDKLPQADVVKLSENLSDYIKSELHVGDHPMHIETWD